MFGKNTNLNWKEINVTQPRTDNSISNKLILLLKWFGMKMIKQPKSLPLMVSTFDHGKLSSSGHYQYLHVYKIWEQSINCLLSCHAHTIYIVSDLSQKKYKSNHSEMEIYLIYVLISLLTSTKPIWLNIIVDINKAEVSYMYVTNYFKECEYEKWGLILLRCFTILHSKL